MVVWLVSSVVVLDLRALLYHPIWLFGLFLRFAMLGFGLLYHIRFLVPLFKALVFFYSTLKLSQQVLSLCENICFLLFNLKIVFGPCIFAKFNFCSLCCPFSFWSLCFQIFWILALMPNSIKLQLPLHLLVTCKF